MTHDILIKEIRYSEFPEIDGNAFSGNPLSDLVHSIIQGIKMIFIQLYLLSQEDSRHIYNR